MNHKKFVCLVKFSQKILILSFCVFSFFCKIYLRAAGGYFPSFLNDLEEKLKHQF